LEQIKAYTKELKMYSRFIVSLLLFICATESYGIQTDYYDNIVINEFLCANGSSNLDPHHKNFSDWIEIYNRGDFAVNLDDLFLTDDLNSPFKWKIPHGFVLGSHQFVIFWADGRDWENHTNFKLGSPAEEIGLVHQDGTIIDAVTYDNQLSDISFGRFPDGDTTWCYFSEATLQKPNDTDALTEAVKTSDPIFDISAGLYSGSLSITISCTTDAKIKYTTDGSTPTSSSKEYSTPIVLSNTTVIRAKAFADGYLPSSVITNTYIINRNTTLPVLSIATNPDYLFDEEIGIYEGICVNDSVGADPPFDPHANFWENWERPVSFEYFEASGNLGFKIDCGIKIFGGAFGRQIRQKAFTIFARNKYNSEKINYKLFNSKSINIFKRIILRCSSNDFNRTFFRDAMMHTLTINQMDVDYQAYEPSICFINGEYWGIYNIREKMNQYYPESNYGIDADEVDLIENIGEVAKGEADFYNNLINFLKSNDISQSANYNYVKTQMDVNEYMNYMMTEIYCRNHDWLHRNTKYWRERSSTGKWRWMLYDLDWGFGGEIREGEEQYKTNSLAWAMNQDEPSIILNSLLTNSEFKNEFIQKFASFLNITFRPERVVKIIDSLKVNIEMEFPRHIERWEIPTTMHEWDREVDILRDFAVQRPHFVFDHISDVFSLSGTTTLTVEKSNSRAGKIYICGVQIPDSTYAGHYFKNIPIRLKAKANYGYKFVQWQGLTNETSDSIFVNITHSASITAVFESVTLPSIVINEIHYNPSGEHQGDDEDFEFVELFNNGSATVDLSNFKFSDGITFAFPSGSSIAAKEYIVVAKNDLTYKNQGYQVFQITDGRLSNSGENLVLADAQNNIVDYISFSDETPWPTAPDANGPSLELKDPSLDNTLADNWSASTQLGGSPGQLNSITTNIKQNHKIPLTLTLYPNYPNPFNSKTIFSFYLPNKSHVKLDIYNILGQKVKTLINRITAVGRNSINWDGKNDQNYAVNSGVYVYQLRTQNIVLTEKILFLK
jgi:hypothetical protein